MLKWVKTKKDRRMALMVEPILHHEIKVHCARNHISVKDFTERTLIEALKTARNNN